MAISREQTHTLSVEFPVATEENLGEVIGYELDRLTPFSADEALFGYRVIGRDDEKGIIKVYLTVLPRAAFEGMERDS